MDFRVFRCFKVLLLVLATAADATTGVTSSDGNTTTIVTSIPIATTTFTNKVEEVQISNDVSLLEYIGQYNAGVDFLSADDLEYDYITDEPWKPEMQIDRAWFTINSTVSYKIEIWAQSEGCYKCDLIYIDSATPNTVYTILVNTTYQTDLRLIRIHPDGTPETLCSFLTTFREGGDYWVFIDYPAPGEEIKCKYMLANDPDIAELPILYVLLGLLALAVLYVGGKRLYSYFRKTAAHRRDSMNVTSDHDGGDNLHMSNGRSGKEVDVENTTATEKEEPEKKKPRLRSLDTFRGFTLVLMIFVNYGGGHYWFFEHAPWNGIYVADVVFPWFVFIMGVSMNFSFKSMFRKGWSVPRITWKIVWRAAKLFAIGFSLGTHHYEADFDTVRVLGVLQRLALTYLISALIHFCCARKFDSHQDRKWAIVRDLVLYVPEWLANLAVLAIHLGIVYGLPVPGCPSGYVGPGGLSEGGKYWNCTGGATQYVDSILLGSEHMYQWPTPKVIYQTTVPFDPEGFLATLNSVFLCFLGIQCGRIILIFQEHKQRLIRMLIWAVALGALAALLTKCSQNDGWIPPNKNLWSLSYTLVTASFGFILLSAMYVITDVLSIWHGQPFIYPGMNSIVIYCCHSMFYKQFPVGFIVEDVHWKLLLKCVWDTAVWVIVSYWLFVKKIFIAL